MKKYAFLLLPAFAVLFSCNPYKELLPGYILYDAPNGIDKPGRVYRLDRSGTDFLVEYLPVDLVPQQIIIKEQEQKKTLQLKSMLSFLSSGNTMLSTDASLNMDREVNFRFKLGEAQVYKLSDQDLRGMYADLKQRIVSDIALFGIEKPEYYIVREAVTAKEILIQLDKSTTGDASFNAKISEMITSNSNIAWTNSEKSEIKVTLEEGLFVFYKPSAINISTSITGATELVFEEADPKQSKLLRIGK